MIMQGMSATAFSEDFFNFGLLCPFITLYYLLFF
jgi:hypothetical protein